MKLQAAIKKLTDIGIIDAVCEPGLPQKKSVIRKRKWSDVLLNSKAVLLTKKLKLSATSFPE